MKLHELNSSRINGRQGRWARAGLSSSALLAAMVFVACSGDVVDLGAGPLDPPDPGSCDDGVQNGEETGIDCGESCSSVCFDEPCICATSDTLMPLSCAAPGGGHDNPKVSADGTTIAFTLCNDIGACRAHYWTQETGRQPLPALDERVHAAAISADGQTLLLNTNHRDSGLDILLDGVVFSGESPFEVVWHRLNGASIATGLLSEPGTLLSEDGKVVMGVTKEEATGETHLTRWSEAGGLERLGSFGITLDLGILWRTVGVTLTTMTPVASLVVGEVIDADGYIRSFRWTAADGLLVGADDFGGAEHSGVILALSRDGSTFAGRAYTGDTRGPHAFHSTPTRGFLDLGLTEEYGTGEKDMALSDDGSVLVGTLVDDRGTTRGTNPFRWTEQSGPQPLRSDGGDYSGPRLISGDGSVLAGGLGGARPFLWAERRDLSMEGRAESRRWDLGHITGLSHAGDVAVGTGQCGGVSAIYRTVLSNW